MSGGLVFGVSDFVLYLNQTLEVAYPYVTIEGEISNFRVSKNRWVYFDLKDESSSVKFFGTVYGLPGPLEDGMLVRVNGNPKLHNLYGFSINFQTIQPVGEGSLRRAADLLLAKLTTEGIFDPARKRPLPYPPERIALITAGSSAAYADFIKIISARWAGLIVDHYDVLVQGEQAPAQIIRALVRANEQAEVPDVIVITRGGGSADDLAAFSTEQVTRAVAGSRVPTLVAIGHEIDSSLAELAADQRASTPSNAAELLTPDRNVVLAGLRTMRASLRVLLRRQVSDKQQLVGRQKQDLHKLLLQAFERTLERLVFSRQLLEAYDPRLPLKRGYALVRKGDEVVLSVEELANGAHVNIQMQDGIVEAEVLNNVLKKENTHGKS